MTGQPRKDGWKRWWAKGGRRLGCQSGAPEWLRVNLTWNAYRAGYDRGKKDAKRATSEAGASP